MPTPFQIVFVSRDNSAEEMKAYMEECHGDWLHVPYDQEVSRYVVQRSASDSRTVLVR